MFRSEYMDGYVELLDSTALEKQKRNLEYLIGLDADNLLFPYYYESGVLGSLNYKRKELHGGWDSPTSHIRGTFTGHYLSAAAHLCRYGANPMLRAKVEYIVSEIRRCQKQNGGRWAFPIPEKYVWSVKEGKNFWAPLYVCHKVMMGLFDIGRFLENKTAFEILEGCTQWFVEFTEQTTEEELSHMMDIQETGGIMELWADLYMHTKDERHLALMRRFERQKLTKPVEEMKDVLTNMHANTTIPEIHGAAKAYEVTGEERYLKILKNYWELAVTKRGMFATGGQTSGEVWTPMMRQSARLGDQNQEHCVVYNMIRLADYLLRFTGKKEYGNYIERNVINGIFAQGHFRDRALDSYGESVYPKTGTVAYYLPLMAGGQKHWGSKTEDFWCCHCTLVQANARLAEYIYYRRESEILVSQYMPSLLKTNINNTEVEMKLTKEDAGVGCIEINDLAVNGTERPNHDSYIMEVHAKEETEFTVSFRVPWWLMGEMQCEVNGEKVPVKMDGRDGYFSLHRKWKDDKIHIILPKGLHTWPLADEPETVAVLDGPVVLAGIVGEERILYGDKERPETFLKPHNERIWGSWTGTYKTCGQQNGFYFKPLYEVGFEHYTVYFPVEKKP